MFKFVEANTTPTLTVIGKAHEALSSALERLKAASLNLPQVKSELDNAGNVKEDRDAAVADKTEEMASCVLEFVVARVEMWKAIALAQSNLSSVHYYTFFGSDAPGDVWWWRPVTMNNFNACARLLKVAVVKLDELSGLDLDVSDEGRKALLERGNRWNAWASSLPKVDYKEINPRCHQLLFKCLAKVAGCEEWYSSCNGAPFFDIDVTGIEANVIADTVMLLKQAHWKVAPVLDRTDPYLRIEPPKGRESLPPKEYKKPSGKGGFWRR
jgi:hypothetical protein